jgi:hypothetical protein
MKMTLMPTLFLLLDDDDTDQLQTLGSPAASP